MMPIVSSRSPPPALRAIHHQVAHQHGGASVAARRASASCGVAADHGGHQVGVRGCAHPGRWRRRRAPCARARARAAGRRGAARRRSAPSPPPPRPGRTRPATWMPMRRGAARGVSKIRVVVVARHGENRGDVARGAPSRAGRRRARRARPCAGRAGRPRRSPRRRASRSAISTISSRAASASSIRSTPDRRLPRCQSPVCSSSSCAPNLAIAASARTPVGDLARGGRPRREGDLHAMGAGTLGWLQQHAPCMSSAAPARAAPAPAQPYSLRSASAASRRPTIRMRGVLGDLRRRPREACCCAPIRITPSERPRCGDVDQRLLDRASPPSRGAYLLSSSSTTNSIGSRPSRPPSREGLREQGAHHEALGEVVQAREVHHRDRRLILGRRRRAGWATASERTSPRRRPAALSSRRTKAPIVPEAARRSTRRPRRPRRRARPPATRPGPSRSWKGPPRLARRARRRGAWPARPRPGPSAAPAPRVALHRDGAPQQLPAHPLLHEAELVAHVRGVREAEPEQALAGRTRAASSRRRLHALVARLAARQAVVVAARGRPERHVGEAARTSSSPRRPQRSSRSARSAVRRVGGGWVGR